MPNLASSKEQMPRIALAGYLAQVYGLFASSHYHYAAIVLFAMAAPADELLQAQPVIEGKVYFVALRRPDALRTSHLAANGICYSIDEILLYEPFFADFGPLNLGKTYRFCRQTQELMQEAERTSKRLYYYCGPHAHNRANAAALVGIFQVIYLNRSAEEAYKPLQAFKPYAPFRDASCGVSTFHLTVLDVIKGVQKARDVAFLDWNSGSSAWSAEEYEHYEQVENGDLNWIVPGKLVAFSGPANRGNEIAGYRLHTPEDYWDYYRKRGVSAVVRLNKKAYDRQRFTAGGFRHYDLYFPDGSCPTEAILLKFLEIAESEPGALAIHCKAGLGRTGVLICCYIMKHFRFTAEEVIGYIRVCRPGSVIGPQQNFLRDVEARMWHEGELWRAARGINKPHLALEDLAINGRATGGNTDNGCHAAPPSSPGSNGTSNGSNGYNRATYKAAPPGSAGGNGSSLVGTRLSQGSPTSTNAGAGVLVRQRRDSATSMNNAAHADSVSLQQYKQQQHQSPATPTAATGMGGYLGLSVQVPSPSASYSNGGSQPNSGASTPTNAAIASHRGTTTSAPRYAGRSITPLRYTSTSAAAAVGVLSSSAGGSIMGGYAARMSAASAGGAGACLGAVTRSGPAGPLMRAPSADRAVERPSLRCLVPSTSERLRSSDLERASSSSSDIAGMMNRMGAGLLSPGSPGAGNGVSAPIPTTPKPAAPGHRPNAGVARTLAPNGQPRKIPMAMLPQYHASLSSKPAAMPLSPGVGMASGQGVGLGSLLSAQNNDIARIKTAAVMRYGLHSK